MCVECSLTRKISVLANTTTANTYFWWIMSPQQIFRLGECFYDKHFVFTKATTMTEMFFRTEMQRGHFALFFSAAEPVLKHVRVLTCRQFLAFVTQFHSFTCCSYDAQSSTGGWKVHTWWTTTQPPWRVAYLTTMHQQWKWLPSTISGKKVREVKIYLFFRTVTFLSPNI